MSRIARVGLIFALLFFGLQGVALATSSNGTIDASYKLTRLCKNELCSSYGNINWKPTINGSTPGASVVAITDSGLSGNLWGDEIGWVNLTPTGGGVTINPTTGVLGGTAYSSVGGWINFSPTGGGVTLVDNGAGSNFSGWAYVSGINGGWMKFDCTDNSTCIKTDWRTTGNRSTGTPTTPNASVLPLPVSATGSPATYPNPPKGELPPRTNPSTKPPALSPFPKEFPQDTMTIPSTESGVLPPQTLPPSKNEVLKLPVGHETVFVVKPSKETKGMNISTIYKNPLPKEFRQRTLYQPQSWVHRLWRSIIKIFSFSFTPQAKAAEIADETIFSDTENGEYRATFVSPKKSGEYQVDMGIEFEDGSVENTRTTLYVLPEGQVYTTSLFGKRHPVQAQIELTKKNASGIYELWTDIENPWWTKNDGAYSIVIPKGNYRLSVSAQGYPPFIHNIDVTEDEAVVNDDIELSCAFWNHFSCLWPIKVIVPVLCIGLLLLFARKRV